MFHCCYGNGAWALDGCGVFGRVLLRQERSVRRKQPKAERRDFFSVSEIIRTWLGVLLSAPLRNRLAHLPVHALSRWIYSTFLSFSIRFVLPIKYISWISVSSFAWRTTWVLRLEQGSLSEMVQTHFQKEEPLKNPQRSVKEHFILFLRKTGNE